MRTWNEMGMRWDGTGWDEDGMAIRRDRIGRCHSMKKKIRQGQQGGSMAATREDITAAYMVIDGTKDADMI